MEQQADFQQLRWVRSGVNWWVCPDGAWTGNVIMDSPTSYRAYLIRWHDGLIAEQIRSTAMYATREEAQGWCSTALDLIHDRCFVCFYLLVLTLVSL